MIVINARNVQEALTLGTERLLDDGRKEESRNGPVLVIDSPVTTVYRNPRERVLDLEARDHNPFFAFFETLWMFAGRNDLETLVPFNRNMAAFSDDGKFIRGSAYGCRWRSWFQLDQLQWLIEHLTNDPTSRRAVLTMWDPYSDLTSDTKDKPCNLQVLFRIRSGQLDITVYNRSNDIVWGAYGSNAVHFSMLQEYMAQALNLEVGFYYQVANNFHAYLENPVFQRMKKWVRENKEPDNFLTANHLYQYGYIPPSMLDKDKSLEDWDCDVKWFWESPTHAITRHSFFSNVALPMIRAHYAWRMKKDPQRFEKAKKLLSECRAEDWRVACWNWLERRQRKAEEK